MATIDPRRIADQKDAWVTALYAKTAGQTADDGVLPLVIDSSGYLCINMTVGSVSLASTASVITNAVGNPVNVSVTNTVVTIGGGSVSSTVSSTSITASTTVTGTVTTNVVAGNINISSATLGTVTISGNVNIATATLGTVTVALSSTKVTIESSVIAEENTASPTRGVLVYGRYDSTVPTALDDGDVGPILLDASGRPRVLIQDIQTPNGDSAMNDTLDSVKVTLTSTEVTVKSAVAGFNVNIATATLGTVTVSLSSTAVSISTAVTYSTIMLTSKTITTGTGTLSATNGTITLTPSARAKVFAISLTTTSATELICIFNSGGVANGVELWRATLMAPAGASAGLNLAVSPPNFLFQSRSGTAVSLSLNTATLIHYSLSYFDEA